MNDYTVLIQERNRNFVFCLKADQSLKSQNLTALATRLISQEPLAQKDLKNAKVVVWMDKGVIKYQLAGNEYILSDDSAILSKTIVKVIRTSKLQLPKVLKSIEDIANDFFYKWSLHKPAARFFGALVIYPLACLMRIFCLKRDDYTSLLSQLSGVASEKSLIHDIQLSLQIFNFEESRDVPIELQLRYQLQEAVQQAETLSKTTFTQQAEQSSHLILDRWKVSQNMAEEQHLHFIATGCWSNGLFHPQLLSFYKNAKGQLALSCFEKNDLNQFQQDFILPQDLTAEDLSKVLKTFFILSFPPAQPSEDNLHLLIKLGLAHTELQERFLEAHLVKRKATSEDLKKQYPEYDAAGPKDNVSVKAADLTDSALSYSFPEDNLKVFYQKLWTSIGAEQVKRENRRTHLANQPWKILHESLRLQFPEIPPSEKFLFTFSLFLLKAQTMTANCHYFSVEERRNWDDRLAKDYESLVRCARKNYGDDIVLDEFLQGSAFLNLQTLFADLKQGLVEKMEQTASFNLKRLDALNEIKTEPYRIPVLPLSKAKKQKILESGLENAFIEEIKIFHALLNSIQGKDALDALNGKLCDQLKNLVNRFSVFVREKQFSRTVTYFHILHEGLPVPDLTSSDNYWNLLIEHCDLSRFSLIQDLSNNLSLLASFFWESKLRLEEELNPDEAVALLNTQVILESLVYARKQEVAKRVEAHLSSEQVQKLKKIGKIHNSDAIERGFKKYGKYADDVDWSEIRSKIDFESLVFLLFDYQDLAIFHKIIQDPFLRTSISPKLNQKLLEIEFFISQCPFQSKPKFPANKERVNIAGFLACVPLWHLYHEKPILVKKSKGQENEEAKLDSQFEKALKLFMEGLLKRDQGKVNKPFLPAQYTDVLRQTILTQSLLDLQLNFQKYLSPYSLHMLGRVVRNGMKRLGDVISGRPEESFEELKKYNHQRKEFIFQKIRSYSRLDISFKYKFRFGDYYANPVLVDSIKKKSAQEIEIIQGRFADDLSSYYKPYQNNFRASPYHQAVGSPQMPFINMSINEEKSESCTLEVFSKFKDPISHWFYACIEDSWTKKQKWENIEKIARNDLITHSHAISPYNVVEVFDLILQRPDKLTDEDVQRRLWLVLFKFNTIKSMIHKHLDYFHLRAQPLKVLIDRLYKQGAAKESVFLIFLCSQIKNHLVFAKHNPLTSQEKNLLKTVDVSLDTLQELIDVWPCFDSKLDHTTYFDLILKCFADANLSFKDQLDLNTYLILDHALKDPRQALPDLLRMPSKMLARFVLSVKKIQTGASFSIIPILSKVAMIWAEEWFFPALANSSIDKDVFLNDYLELYGDLTNSAPWKQVKKTSFWEKGETLVDLSSMNIIRLNGKKLRGFLSTLPSRVTSSEEYRSLFGEISKAAKVSLSEDPNTLIYRLVDLPFRVLYSHVNQEFLIDQKIELNGEKRWYRLAKPSKGVVKKSKKSFISNLYPKEIKKIIKFVHQNQNEPRAKAQSLLKTRMEQKGFWHCLNNPNEGLIFCLDMTQPKKEECLRLTFNHQQLKKIQTPSGREVIEPSQKFYSAFAPLALEKFFYAKKKHEDFVSEFFIPACLTLSRQSFSSSWEVTEGQAEEKGMVWKIGAKATAVEDLFKSVGQYLEQFAIVLEDRDERNCVVYLWPHLVTKEKEGCLFHKDETSENLLKLHFDSQGNLLKAPLEGLLYLAYLFTFFKDAQRAFHFLEMSRRASPVKPNALEGMRAIAQAFRCLPGFSYRQNILKLKAELAIRKVLREHSQSEEGQLAGSQDSLTGLQQISSFFDVYLHRKTHPQFKAQLSRDASAKELELSSIELEELKAIQLKSFHAYFVAKPLETAFRCEKFLRLEVERHMGVLLIQMQPPHRHFNFENLHPLKFENMAQRFFELWNYIITENLQINDLLFLFGPAEQPYKEVLMKDQNILNKEMFRIVNFCRKMLLGLASLPIEQRQDLKYNLKRNYALKRGMPRSIKGVMWKGLLGWLKERSFAFHVRMLLRPITKLNERMEAMVHYGKSSLIQASAEKMIQDRLNPDDKIFNLKKYLADFPGNPLMAVINSNDLPSTILPFNLLVQQIESATSLNLVLEQNKKVLTEAAQALEKKLTMKPIIQEASQSIPELNLPLFEKDGYFLEISHPAGLTIPKIDQALKTLSEDLYQGNLEDLNYLGMQKAAERLKEEQQDSHKIFNLNQLGEFHQALQRHVECLQKASADHLLLIKTELESTKDQLPQTLFWAIVNQHLLSPKEFLTKVMDQYQKADSQLPLQLSKAITEFLLIETERFQFAFKVPLLLQKLSALADLKLKAEDFEEWNIEWKIVSTQLHALMNSATNRWRYTSINSFTKKYLVTEYRSQIIMRPLVCQLIEKIVANPLDWYELRPGLGKTTYVLPLILNMLSEKGCFPVGIIKEELISQNLEVLDPRTKLLAEQSAVKFSFDLKDPHTSLTLCEQYYHLLKAKEAGSYAMTTIHQLANIEHQMILYRREMNVLLTSEDLTQKATETLAQISELQQKIYWISKIRNFFKRLDPDLQFQVVLFGDEVDEIFNVLYENNLGLSSDNQMNGMICEIMEILMLEIFTSRDPDLILFKKSLRKGIHASFEERQLLEVIFPKIVEKLPYSDRFQRALGCYPGQANTRHLEKMKKEDFVDFFCKVWENNPHKSNPFSHFEESQPLKEGISALKDLLQAFKIALDQDFYIDYALKEDGYTVGPRTSGAEKKGMYYGKEYDIICNQYLYFASRLEDTQFLLNAIKKLQDTEPHMYEKLFSKAHAKGLTLVAYLKKGQCWEERLYLLKSQVIQTQLILSNKLQCKLSLQSLVQNSQVGGMTGTLNPYLLPKTGNSSIESYLQGIVEGETYLRIGATTPPPVVVLDEAKNPLTYFSDCAQDDNCKAIINEGLALNGMNALEVVERLRKSCPQRIYVFIHPEKRKPFVWDLTKADAYEITQKGLEQLYLSSDYQKKLLFYYGPPDSRGTDFSIPFGYVSLFTGLTTSTIKFGQAVWRARGLGEQHKVRFFIPKAIAKKIDPNSENLSWTQLIKFTQGYTRSKEKSLCLKAQIERIKTLLITGARDIICHNPMNLDIFEFNKTAYQMPELLVENFLFQVFEPLMIYDNQIIFKNLEVSFLEDISLYMMRVFDEEKLKVKDFMAKLSQPLFRLHPKVQAAMQTLNHLLKKLIEEEQSFFKTIRTHLQYLPPKVCNVGDQTPCSQAHVQQQAQQQQQSQQQEQQIEVNESLGLDPKRSPPKRFNKWAEFEKLPEDDCGFSPILLSPNAKAVLDLLPKGRRGQPIFKVFIRPFAGRWKPAFVTHLDFHLVLEENIKKWGIKEWGLYSLMNGFFYEDGVLPIQTGEQAPELAENEEVFTLLVQLKCFLGYYQYSEKEKRVLTSWVKGLDEPTFHRLLEFTQEKCTMQLKDLLFALR